MSSYLIAGSAAVLVSALTSLAVFSYRSGRNSSRVKSEERDISDAIQSATNARNMLEARTNGLRSDNDLLSSLNNGKF